MDTIICYTKGASQGNPGPSTIRVSIMDTNGDLIKELEQSVGNAKQDFAEYNAVMVGLQTLQALYGDSTKTLKFELRLDSELVAKQLKAESQINDPGLVPMFIEIHNMQIESFPYFSVSHIPRQENIAGNTLLKENLDGKQ